MTTELSLNPAKNGTFWEKGIRVSLSILRTVILPHLVAGLGVFALISYVTYERWLVPLTLPGWLHSTILCIFLGIYGSVILAYSLLAASIFALRLACVAWEEFIEQILDRVKERMLSHLDGVQDGIAKEQAKVLVRGSVREVILSGRQRLASLPKWICAVFLGALALALRSVLIARIVKVSGATIKLSKLFASRATLAGAVFLNLRLFATLLLGVTYFAGGMMLLVALVLVCS